MRGHTIVTKICNVIKLHFMQVRFVFRRNEINSTRIKDTIVATENLFSQINIILIETFIVTRISI